MFGKYWQKCVTIFADSILIILAKLLEDTVYQGWRGCTCFSQSYNVLSQNSRKTGSSIPLLLKVHIQQSGTHYSPNMQHCRLQTSHTLVKQWQKQAVSSPTFMFMVPQIHTLHTDIWLVVRVPVLSEQMTEVQPRVSTDGKLRTIAFFFAILLVPVAKQYQRFKYNLLLKWITPKYCSKCIFWNLLLIIL